MMTSLSVTVQQCVNPTELFRQYAGQSEPQSAYIALSLETGGMWASYDAIVGSGTPEEVHNGRERWYGIPVLTAAAANALMDELVPLAARVVAGSEIEFNGNGNRVGVLNGDAQAAEEEIEARLGNGPGVDRQYVFAEGDMVAGWDLDGALNGSEVDDYGITAATTDDRLAEIEAKILADLASCGESGTVVCAGLDEHLQGLRDELLKQDKAVYWSVMRGESPDSDAVQPEPAGITVPEAVLEWAAGHGLSVDDPDVYLLVAPQEGAQSLTGEIDFMEGTLSDQEAVALRAALDAQDAERAERNTTPDAL